MSNAFQGRTDAAGPITCSLIISGRFTQGTVSDCVHADLNMERHLNVNKDRWDTRLHKMQFFRFVNGIS
ncbi:MAG TPA: hypothetical protein EYN71_06535 [Flavobacteriales bacterium]|jgi:hypothetical protein|nr:hypothetical protein [Flavobacteriales bacterium]HIO66858.1 hypothetical protein [Flavobacteriales bacterium]